MVSNRFIVALLLLFFLLSCRSDRKAEMADIAIETRDLNEIQSDGKLTALIAYSGTSYFLYKGRPMGYEYELLQKLAEHFELELELKVSKNLDLMLEELNSGTIDIVAHGLAITKDRQKEAAFTDYLYLTNQVLVQRKPSNWRKMSRSMSEKEMIQDPVELLGDTISVRRNSSYYKRLLHLSDELGGDIIIDTLDGNISTDEIIKMVADGKIKYTIADSNLANINASYYPILDVSIPISNSQRIAWAVHPEAEGLLDATNSWIRSNRKKKEFNIIYNKYFKNKRSFRRRVKSEFFSLNNNQISQYDDIIKTNAKNIGWDWRLLASVVYQESRFINEAKSWTGAQGLMQMLPATAAEMGVNNIMDATDNIRGGSLYLKKMFDEFSGIDDPVQRIKFTLAAYNCGLYHVKDAQKLAEENKLDTNTWDGQVDQMILALSYPKNYNKDIVKYGYVNGIEPFKYVSEVFERYNHYTQFISE